MSTDQTPDPTRAIEGEPTWVAPATEALPQGQTQALPDWSSPSYPYGDLGSGTVPPPAPAPTTPQDPETYAGPQASSAPHVASPAPYAGQPDPYAGPSASPSAAYPPPAATAYPPAYPPAYPAGAPIPAAPAPYPPAGYAGAPATTNTSALILTIASGVVILFCAGFLTIPALIFGILGLTKQQTDPAAASQYAKWGWIAFAIGVAVTVLVVVIFFGAFLAALSGATTAPY